MGCAAPRATQTGTWIVPEMVDAYCRLHELGYAHSIECRVDDALVGGLYGVAIGRMFFGESMFSAHPDASKVALAHLCRLDFGLVDCQLPSEHLFSLGARTCPREEFCERVARHCAESGPLSGAVRDDALTAETAH